MISEVLTMMSVLLVSFFIMLSIATVIGVVVVGLNKFINCFTIDFDGCFSGIDW